jgi:subtilisin-like proprotein convertase family protein
MQSKTTLKKIRGFFYQTMMILGLFCFLSSALQAQQYVNGNLSTGATTSNGTAAPAGFTWSEVQVGNVNAGFGAQIANNLALADDFTVPGAAWTVSKFTFYAYSTGYTGTTSPFEDLRLQIYDTDPSTGTAVPVYGNLTTNALTASSPANVYRIFNATAGTTRLIWKLEANVNVVLPAGTYWVEWQTGVAAGLTSNFTPPSTIVGATTQAGYNAKQHDLTANTCTALTDGTTIPNNFQDFNFIVDYATSGCTGTPDAGTTISSVASACPGTPFNLGISSTVSGSGITYQWQSSPDNVTFTNITGATSNSYTTSLTASTWYRLAVTCTHSGSVGYSVPVQVSQTPASGCYCTSSSTSTADEEILRVKIGTLDNTSTCSTLAPGFGSVQNKYSNYTSGTGAPAPGVVIAGGTNPISIQIGTCGGNFTNSVAVWMDLNHNGSLEASEKVYVSPSGTQGPHVENGNAFIPATAILGTTLMRVVNVETGTPGNINPCGTYTWGETEDYLVDLRACVPVTLTSSPTSQATSCGGTVTFTATANGDNPSFTWEQRTSPTSTWTLVTNGGMFSGATTNSLTITGATSSMSGYQYRAIFTGSCTAVDFSGIATLTVNPLTATVNPASANICNGSSQALQITNSASSNVTATVASGAINLIITDADAAGVETPAITTSNIPANAVVADISVKFNMTHTFVGDVVVNLVAPNGEVLNLVGKLNNGTGFNATDNFTNTVISSTSTTAISGAAAPRTGTFAAEKRVGFGPTAYVQTTTDWATMLTTLNGDWKLAMADDAFGDEGTLIDWQITITYTSPILASGTWSPTTALFTDAALTTAYTGGDVNTVYAAPTTSTDYTVIVNTGICSSSPLVVPVTVSNPINAADVTNPSNASVCANGNVTFSSNSTSGNPIEFQWEESTDGGATWTAVTNGGAFSGATTSTLTITGASSALNQHQYRLAMSVSACSSNVNSASATLTVNANPSVSLSAAPFNSLYPGLVTTLTANATPASASNVFVWTYNGSQINGQTGGTRAVDIDGMGDYTATVTDANGCSSSVSNVVTVTDSLNTSLFIYPNPNRGVFQVRYNNKLTGVANPRYVNIYDSKGARVYRKAFAPANPFGRMDVDLRNAAKGVYYIDLTDAAGVRLQSERVVLN